MSNQYIPFDTPLIITRLVKQFGERHEHGPKTYAEAVADNDLTTSSGTVMVSIVRASDRSPVSVVGERLVVGTYDPAIYPEWTEDDEIRRAVEADLSRLRAAD